MGLVLHGPVITDGRRLPPSRVEVGSSGQVVALEPRGSARGADLVVPAGNGWILPGLIELHLHGAGGVDLTAAPDPAAAVAEVARTLARHGVTAFCPTLVSADAETYRQRLAALGPRPHAGGAASLGVYLEGPYLNPAHRGVQDPRHLRAPDQREAREWLALGPPAVVALAPELPGAGEVIGLLAGAGTLVALGHSGASLAQAQAGLAAGARHATHLFNAMPPLHHREPGLVGALLLHQGVSLELIGDGIHLGPSVVELVVRAAGVQRVALVSDALAAAGLPPGPVQLGEQTVVSDGTVARRADGTLAGAAVLVDTCLRNAISWLSAWLPPAQIVRMATETPARALGPAVAGRKGRVAPGYDADFTIVGPDWRVRATVVGGVVVYRADEAGEGS